MSVVIVFAVAEGDVHLLAGVLVEDSGIVMDGVGVRVQRRRVAAARRHVVAHGGSRGKGPSLHGDIKGCIVTVAQRGLKCCCSNGFANIREVEEDI